MACQFNSPTTLPCNLQNTLRDKQARQQSWSGYNLTRWTMKTVFGCKLVELNSVSDGCMFIHNQSPLYFNKQSDGQITWSERNSPNDWVVLKSTHTSQG